MKATQIAGSGFDPERLGFEVDLSSEHAHAWTLLVSRRPYVRFQITLNRCDEWDWRVHRHVGSQVEDDPIGETEFNGRIPDHRFGCELLRNLGFPEDPAGLCINPDQALGS